MRRLIFTLLAALALVSAACTPPSSDGEAEETLAPSTTELQPEESNPDESVPEGSDPTLPGEEGEDPALMAAILALGGELAVTAGPNVLVMPPDGSDVETVGGAVGEPASQPVWTGSTLAWYEATRADPGIRIDDGGETPERIIPVEGLPVFYMQWSPEGDRLAFLRNDEATGRVQGQLTSEDELGPTIGQGTPLFVHWGEDNTRLVTNNGRQLSLVDPPSEGILIDPVAGFGAPVWVDEDTIMAATDRGIVSYDLPDGPPITVVAGTGAARFVLSPDGTKLAFVMELPADSDTIPLRVLDVETGLVTNLTSFKDGPIAAFEWDPNSERLAYLAQAEAGSIGSVSHQPGSTARQDESLPELRWFFWDDGFVVSATQPFTPSELEVRAYLPFFDQYALSHSRWSPGGEGFAFAGTVEGDSGIWVQLVNEQIPAVRVSDGEAVTWNSNGGGGGGTSPARWAG